MVGLGNPVGPGDDAKADISLPDLQMDRFYQRLGMSTSHRQQGVELS
jgi:hypothetical protein